LLNQNKLNFLVRSLLTVSIFFLFSQLSYYFWPHFSYINGSRIDYLSPTLYFSDIPLFLLTIIYFVFYFKFLIKKTYLFVIFFVFLNIYFSTIPIFTFYLYIKLLSKIIFIYFLSKNFLTKKRIINIFLLSLFITIPISILQIINQRSFYNFFYFFGERKFTLNTIGISTFSIFNYNFIRPMSTFSHPNLFSAYLVISYALLLDKKNYSILFTFFSAMLIVIMFFTNSSAIIISFLLSFVIYKHKVINKFFFMLPFLSILLIIFSKFLIKLNFNLDISERFYLNLTSLFFLKNNFLIGVGLGNYLFNFNSYTDFVLNNFNQFLNRFWVQPVHNIYLLILSELGIVGLVIFYLFFSKLILKSKSTLKMLLMFILISGLFDHFWLSLQQGQLMFCLIVGLILNKNSAKISNNE